MKKTLFVLAPPDHPAPGTTATSSTESGYTRVEIDLAGVLPIMPFVEGDPVLKSHSARVILGVQQFRLPPRASVNLFNLVGDADSSRKMLRNIQALETRLQPLRCFNRPVNVLKTARERLPETLGNIPGCISPPVKSADPGNFAELKRACRDFGRWPVIIRARGYHGGEHMVLIREETDLDSIRDETWPYRGVHLVEYVDFKHSDGLYQKNRVIMVNGAPLVRHGIVSDSWAIHAGSREDLMDRDPGLRAREKKFLADFSQSGLKKYARVFRKIHQRVGLDIFGIDFALKDDQVVVFEANACMHFLDHVRVNRDYDYLDPYVKSLQQAVKRLLVRA
jgi:hypothetical protein